MIELKNISKIYKPKKGKETLALNNISFRLPEKGLFFLLGKSGSGKSTLLNIVGLLDKPTNGEVIVNGESISKFKERKITSYRNNYIGFIFQEFNLFEELNVYDNIDLSLNLKKDKDKIKVENILKKVGLENFAKRKVNELSGGEKQRVAIARALIKSPKVILADEPTGNLDQVNSKQIFEILKSVSKERLVLVVSHDRESANIYGDGIIEIADGKIVSNNLPAIADFSKEIKFAKSHLNFQKRAKLAWGILRKKKIRLVFTIILISIAFALFGFSMSLQNFDIARIHAEAMSHENESTIILKKSTSRNDMSKALFNAEISKIVNNLDSDYNIVKVLYLNDNIENVNFFGYDRNFEKNYDDNAFYSLLNNLNETYFITYTEEELKNLDIIGNVPENDREILIPEILAEYMLVHNFYILNKFEEGKMPDTELINVNSKEELIGKKVVISGGWDYLVISGIIKDPNIKNYVPLKLESYSKMERNPSSLYQDFVYNYKNKLFTFAINENFFEVSNFSSNVSINNDLFKSSTKYNNKENYKWQNFSTNSVINCYDGQTIKNNCQANTGEIIISWDDLDWYYDYEISNLIADAYEEATKEYNEKVKKRNSLLKEQENLCQETGACDYEEIPEIALVDIDKITEEVHIKFAKEHNIIGADFLLNLTDTYGYYEKGKVYSYNLKIVGLLEYSNDRIINEEQFKDFILPNEIVWYIKVNESNEDKLKNIFETFANTNIQASTVFSDQIIDVANIINSIEKISNYIAIGFLIFSIILLTIFITSSITINKKKVGILRALGTSIFDVIRIFIIESVIIGTFTFVLANVLAIIGINITNVFITKEIDFYLRAIVFNEYTIIFIILSIIIVTILSLVIPIIRLSKEKPINLMK